MRPVLDGDKQKLSKWEMASKVPTLSVGVVGMGVLLVYMIRGYKTRVFKESFSDYVIKTRLVVQGFITLSLTAGVGYNIYQYRMAKFEGKDTKDMFNFYKDQAKIDPVAASETNGSD